MILVQADEITVQNVIDQYHQSISVFVNSPLPPITQSSPAITSVSLLGQNVAEHASQDSRSEPVVHAQPCPAGTVDAQIPRLDRPYSYNAHAHQDDDKKAVNVRAYCKDNEFSGDEEKQTISEILLNSKSAIYNRISPSRRRPNYSSKPLKELLNAFNHEQNENKMYAQRVDAMKAEYDSEERKNQVQAELEFLTLTSFMYGRGMTSEDQGLKNMINHINISHPQMRSNCSTFVMPCFNLIGLMQP